MSMLARLVSARPSFTDPPVSPSLFPPLTALVVGAGAAPPPRFTARPDPRWRSRVLMVLVGGPVVATALGWCWIAIDADGQAPGTSQLARVQTAFVGLFGFTGPVQFVSPVARHHAAIALL